MLTLAKDDLTSAALVTLMRISFAEQGIEIDATGGLRWGGGPHASLSAKSATADAVLARHGPVTLLKVGRAIPRMAFDPIGAALLSASDGQDLLARWLRLERYVHTLHPILMRSVTATSARLVHQRGSDGTPNVAVNLILAGVICGLLGAVGCRRLSLAIGSGPIKDQRDCRRSDHDRRSHRSAARDRHLVDPLDEHSTGTAPAAAAIARPVEGANVRGRPPRRKTA